MRKVRAMSPVDHAPDPAMLAKAETLVEALPSLQRYKGKTFVVKYGGHDLGHPAIARDLGDDVVSLKAISLHPIVVHDRRSVGSGQRFSCRAYLGGSRNLKNINITY